MAEIHFPDNLKAGDILTLGHYPQDKEGRTLNPIEWRVLATDDDLALVVTEHAIDCFCYDALCDDDDTQNLADEAAEEGITWETSGIRRLLNECFYDYAFTEEEKDHIILTELDNRDIDGVPGGSDTIDRIFLLSLDEAGGYLGDDTVCTPTEYAKENGALPDSETGGCRWFLRSPGSVPETIGYGSTKNGYYYTSINDIECGMRPAMTIVFK